MNPECPIADHHRDRERKRERGINREEYIVERTRNCRENKLLKIFSYIEVCMEVNR